MGDSRGCLWTDTLYGYMMGVFARIDVYSSHWSGSSRPSSKRMVSFMCAYWSIDRRTASLAVHFWRHKLMHTAAPRQLRSATTGTMHRWLLHWGDEHLPREQHFKLQSDDKVLSLSLFGLIDDLRILLAQYNSELAIQSDLQTKYDAVARELERYELKVF